MIWTDSAAVLLSVHNRLTSMFLASKTEEQRMSLDSFLHDIKEITGTSIPSAVIRKTEPVLLEGIKFHLAPLHPYASLSAFMHDFGTLLERTGTPLDNMEQVFATATATARGALATDVLFIATPGLIALASLVDACNMHQVYQEQVQRYVLSYVPPLCCGSHFAANHDLTNGLPLSDT